MGNEASIHLERNTLAYLHCAGRTNFRVTTDGNGHGYVEVPLGNDLGGHLDTVVRACTVGGWQPSVRGQIHLIPTYAYDRIVVAGLGCSTPVASAD